MTFDTGDVARLGSLLVPFLAGVFLVLVGLSTGTLPETMAPFALSALLIATVCATIWIAPPTLPESPPPRRSER